GPRNTSVSASPSAAVVLGSSVSLSCSSDANPAVLNYTWYRENREQIGTGNHLTINTTDSTQSGLYYCRAQNQHGDHNSSVYLDVQYAPQLSPSSSCNKTQELIICFCEVDGNPSPKLEWRLSNQTVLSSETGPIQVQSVGNMSLRRSISFTIPQSVKDTPTLHCVGSNHLGIASQVFFLTPKPQCPAAVSGVNISSVLIGAVVGALVMMILGGISLGVRKLNPLEREPTVALPLNERKEDEESVYVNRAGLSGSPQSSTAAAPHGEGNDIRGVSSDNAFYNTVHHCSGQQTEGGIREAALEEVKETSLINMDGAMMQTSAEEEALYGNVTRQPELKQTQGVTIVKPIVFGNVARYFGKKREEDGHTHQWTVYVKPYRNEDMSAYVKKIQFKLHESYGNPLRVVTKPPYEITETGWGEFEIIIKIFFIDPNERPVTLYHLLKLFQSDSNAMPKKTVVSEFYDEMIFQDPTAMMQQLLNTTRQLTLGAYKHETE
ncbi:YEATS domain-containing protein 4, partial [Clarias magur]